MDGPLALQDRDVPAPDPAAEPDGFVVLVEPSDRIHFLDWGGPPDAPGVLLVHGIAQTAWVWAPVARRLTARRRVVAMDLRGHGLSDSPTGGYDEPTLAADVIAAAEGSGLLAGGPVVLAGHGFGGFVAAAAAAELGEGCAGLVLVDGGWEDLRAATGLEPDEFLRTIDEPPEVLASIDAFLVDRAGFDPASWDADQERAARASVVETAAGRVVPATRPHALAGSVEALFGARPAETLSRVLAPIVALVAAEDEQRSRGPALERAQAALVASGRPAIHVVRFPATGHNLMRYRPADVTAAILQVSAAGRERSAE
jgi:pimeloyl-ACP methyl ester carboxylesterase